MKPGEKFTNEIAYKIRKVKLYGDHTEKSSNEAMVEGCYKILNIQELPPKTSADNPNLFIATAKYKAGLSEEFDDFEIFIRLNPLVNVDATGNFKDWARKNNVLPDKSLRFFESVGERIIYVNNIQLKINKEFGSKRYIYDWDVEE